MRDKKRFILKALIDVALINLAIISALILRFDGQIPQQYLQGYLRLIGFFNLTHLACNYYFGLHKRLWQYSGIHEMRSIFGAASSAVLINVGLSYFLQVGMPRSTYILTWIFSIGLLGGFRIGLRMIRSGYFTRKNGDGPPALIIGAGQAGVMVVKELQQNRDSTLNVVGFIDDDPQKQKSELLGLPILGTRQELPALAAKHGIEEIIIAMPSAPGAVIREVTRTCANLPVRIRTLPGICDLIEGNVALSQIREVTVEDLLRRDPVSLDLEDIARYLTQRCVLVTGAGGSIGSELCRQICLFKPGKLLLLGHDENPIFEIDNELHAGYPALEIIPIIADIKDRDKLRAVFEKYKPDVVFHAAAHKHVPLMEAHPVEAIKNNIFGTYNLAQVSSEAKTGVFVLISTDKAVNPSCVMGATKRIAEMIVQSYAGLNETRFVAVRFGNVMGSRGSVLEVFREQIQRGGPLTVTHPEMTRYFMTIREAAQLVVQAGAIANGGELFVLDMGQPVKIMDLARDFIAFSGYTNKDMPINIVGIRPGEKLHEELVAPEETAEKTRHPRIIAVQPKELDADLFGEWLQELAYYAFDSYDPENLARMLKQGLEISGRVKPERFQAIG